MLNEFNDSKDFELFSDLDCLDRTEKYDVIFMFHVIEHLVDPISYLSKLRTYLAKDGMIVIECPNARDALLSLYRNKSFKKFYYWSQHLFYFRKRDLIRIIQESGFLLIRSRLCQRYSYDNHLRWIIKGRGGGHKLWSFIRLAGLETLYASFLSLFGSNDTILIEAGLSKRASKF